MIRQETLTFYQKNVPWKLYGMSLELIRALGLKRLPPELHRKAEGVLKSYGGLDGLGKKPAWIVGAVLKNWFSVSERKILIDYLVRNESPDAKLSLLKATGLGS